MARTPTALLSPADQQRRRDLRRMKGVALGALLGMAVVFAVAFALQRDVEWLQYVRAAAEGGMVGALADWFAVTALFRHPLGLPIPHTAIIPRRKDEIGQQLGEFVETNFLEGHVVRTKLEGTPLAARAGAWLAEPAHADRLAAEGATIATSVLRALSDDDVQGLIEDLARDHLLAPDWGPSVGGWLERVVGSGAHHGAVDLALDNIAVWLANNHEMFQGLVSRRLPSWVPSLAHRFVDDTVYREAVGFVDAVRADPRHQARAAIDQYLGRLADNLQHDPGTMVRLEEAKASIFDSPRVRGLAADAWNTAKPGLLASLADPDSAGRRGAAAAERGVPAASRRRLGHRCSGLPRRAVPPRHRLDHHRHGGTLGCRRDHREDRAHGGARSPVHPSERHGRRGPRGPRDLHGRPPRVGVVTGGLARTHLTRSTRR